MNSDCLSKLPTTAIRFRPEGSRAKTKNVLLSVDADGNVQHWHLTSGKCLSTITDKENPLLCVDYRPDGEVFAAAGKDYKVRLYDESSKALVATLSGGFGKLTPGHSNRVFSLKFHPTDPNILISGGWDNTVQIWDIRVEEAVQSFYGPHISGDSVDIRDNIILTGSWRPDEQLQFWDYGSGKLMETIPWFSTSFKGEPCLIYTAQFSKGTDFLFAAGGSGSNETKVFDHSCGNEIIGTISGLTRGVYTLDFSPTDPTLLAIGGGDTSVRIISVEEKSNERD